MDIESLRSFLILAQYANFTRASEQLYVTQPTLSRRIQSLERELGISLFERDTQQVTLTEPGQVAQREILEIVRRWENLSQIVSQDTDKCDSIRLVGTLRIGHQRDIDNTFLMRLIRVMSQLYPGIKITVKNAMPSELKSDLAAQRCDAAFYLEPPIHFSDDPCVQVLDSSPMLLMVSKDHPFAQRESVCIREIKHENVLMLDRQISPAIVDFVNGQCVANGFSIEADRYVSDTRSALAIVAAGKGIAFVHSAAQELMPTIASSIHLVCIEDIDLNLDYLCRVRTNISDDLREALLCSINEVSQGEKSEL